jgi:glycerol-3-phosphate acyltransferase PlsY
MNYFFVFLGLAYFLGSIPTAVWYAKIFHKIDIREHGSGNPGATNSLRVLGKTAGITVLIFDIVKGYLVMYLASYYLDQNWQLFAIGITAVVGHIFPIFSQFRGGKGVATAFGVILFLNPFGALISAIVFFIVVFISRYVSLSSLLGAFAFAIFLTIKFTDQPLVYGMAFFLSFLLSFTHRENISRLLNGNENKFPPKKA